jgi:hypothetical protein
MQKTISVFCHIKNVSQFESQFDHSKRKNAKINSDTAMSLADYCHKIPNFLSLPSHQQYFKMEV